MNHFQPIIGYCILSVFFVLPPVSSAQIEGKVSKVEDQTIRISSASDLLPTVGDKLDIFVEVPGVGKAQVGSATVSKVEDDVIYATIGNSTGPIVAGQLVSIKSPKPTRRPGTKVPILLGRTAGDARKAVEAAGFESKFEVGIPAPPEVKPFTVYAQKPAANAELAKGGQIVVTLYGDNAASPPAPNAPSSDTARPVASKLEGPSDQTRRIVMVATKLLEDAHISAHPLDDEISRRTFDEILRGLDGQKLYFFQSDVDEFKRDRYELDDLLKKGDMSFAYTIFHRYLQRIDERVREIKDLLELQHDFTVDEAISVDYETLTYPRDGQEARERWRKRIKYDLLNETAAGVEVEEARRKLRVRYTSFLDRMKQYTDDELLEATLTHLAHAYDPNSSYISAKSWDNFVISNERQMVGIGAALHIKDGEVIVTKIIAGSPSHKDGRLHAGDRIVAVGQGETGEPVDIRGMPLSDAVALIRGTAGTDVRLQVVPKGKFEANVYAITRQKFDLAKAQGTILSGDQLPDGRRAKLGFVLLPSFYRDWGRAAEGQELRSSATRDVRNILTDFKSKGVDIVVLDLRTNTGGSLTEAIDLTGLFIDRGTVLQVKGRDGQVQRYDDTHKGTAWDKPLVLLTSSYTASGAEILAGALQDFRRALIIGDTSTHGSGIIHDLKNMGEQLFKVPNPPNLGRLKVAMQRFYLPSGVTTQLRGVLSDIVLPSVTNVTDVREQHLRYPLQFDKISAASFEKVDFGLDASLVASLREQSTARRAALEYFRKLAEQIEAYRKQKGQKSVSLNKEAFLARQQAVNTESEQTATLADIPDVRANSYLDEALSVALDYLARVTFAQAEADYKAKRYSEAISKYKAAVADDPQYITGHYKLAWALATGRVRDGTLAVTHAEKAVELDQENKWPYRLALAVAHAEAGDFSAAQEQLASALNMAPESERDTYRFLEQRFRNRQAYPR